MHEQVGFLGSSPKVLTTKRSVSQTDEELRPAWSPSLNLDDNTGTKREGRRFHLSASGYKSLLRPQHHNDQSPSQDPRRDGRDQVAIWKTGIWARFPVLAIASLVGVVACTAAAIGVLVSSNGSEVQTWRFVAPSVCLAILSVVSNTLLGVALAEGLVISFWRTILRSCTLSEMNRNWHCGYSLWQALSGGFRRGGRITSLACIFAILSLLRGPLNQRASYVDSNVRYDTQGELELQIAQRLPDGYTGISVDSRASVHETAMLTPAFNDIMSGYTSHLNMALNHTECGEICTATVKGFGFKVDCEVKNISSTQDNSAPSTQDLFDTSVDLYRIAPHPDNIRTFFAGLQLNATFYEGFTDEKLSNGTLMTHYLTSHTCKLQAGIVAYKVSLTRETVSLSSRRDDEFLELVNLTAPATWGLNSVIGGFQYAGNYLFKSKATFQFAGAISATTLEGPLANQNIANASNAWMITFHDPMETMLDAIREIAFRASLRAGKDNATVTDAQQSVLYTGHNTQTIYVTDTVYVAIGALISLISVVAVGATLYGWWQLGRNMSMSPLEIAKAFDAPLLRDMGSNVSHDRIPTCIKSQRIQYGVGTAVRKRSSTTSTEGWETKYLIVGPVDSVQSPEAGVAYAK